MARAATVDMTALLDSALKAHKKRKPIDQMRTLLAAGLITTGDFKKVEKRLAAQAKVAPTKKRSRSRA